MQEVILPLMQFHKDHGNCDIVIRLSSDVIRITAKEKHVDFEVRGIAYDSERYANFGCMLRMISDAIRAEE